MSKNQVKIQLTNVESSVQLQAFMVASYPVIFHMDSVQEQQVLFQQSRALINYI